MSFLKRLYSRNFFIFNLVLVGVLLGAGHYLLRPFPRSEERGPSLRPHPGRISRRAAPAE